MIDIKKGRSKRVVVYVPYVKIEGVRIDLESLIALFKDIEECEYWEGSGYNGLYTKESDHLEKIGFLHRTTRGGFVCGKKCTEKVRELLFDMYYNHKKYRR